MTRKSRRRNPTAGDARARLSNLLLSNPALAVAMCDLLEQWMRVDRIMQDVRIREEAFYPGGRSRARGGSAGRAGLRTRRAPSEDDGDEEDE